MKPDPSTHLVNGDYIRALIKLSGLDVNPFAKRIGKNPRTVRYWRSWDHPFEYPEQYTAEKLTAYTLAEDRDISLSDAWAIIVSTRERLASRGRTLS